MKRRKEEKKRSGREQQEEGEKEKEKGGEEEKDRTGRGLISRLVIVMKFLTILPFLKSDRTEGSAGLSPAVSQ